MILRILLLQLERNLCELMKRKLFLKEFIEKRKLFIFFSVVLMISFFIPGFEYVMFSSSIDNGYKPDVYMRGVVSDNIFEFYKDTDSAVDYIMNNSGSDIRTVPCVTRRIVSCTEDNKYNTVTYTIKGYSDDYISQTLSKYLAKGRVPDKEKNEVIIGSGFAKVMRLSVGDKISGQCFNIGTIGEVVIAVSLEKDNDFSAVEEYTVSGIISEDCTFLKNSAVAVLSDEIKPNTIELFFEGEDAVSTYKSLIDKIPEGQIGGLDEFYVQKKNEINSLITDITIIAVSMLTIIYLVISLLLKGINKKLSVMKAVGVKDRYIVTSFFGGFLLIMLVSIVLALLLLIVVVTFMNRQYSEFIGVDINKYKLDITLFVFMLCTGLFISINLWAILKYKIAKVNPKIDL